MALIDRIKNVRFSTTRLASGYEEREVDDFLDQLVATISSGGRLDAAAVSEARFHTTRLRPGYTKQDVDAFLDELIRDANRG
jgi:DivIVA domain-containing protein